MSSALISPERRRLPTTTVLFLFFYFVLAPETLRTSVEGRTITHIQRKRNGRFVRLILFGLLGLTYRGVSVRGRGVNDAGENGRRGEKGKKNRDAHSLRFRVWLLIMGIGLGSKLAWKGSGA